MFLCSSVFSDTAPEMAPPGKKPYPYGASKPAISSKEKAPQEPPSEFDTFPNDSSSFRFSATHREANGIGYDQGYTSLDGFFAFSSIGSWHPFFDFRAHLFNDGRPAANVGFGLRFLPKTLPAVFGINGFFDIKNTKHSTFEQSGIGIEILGTKWFMRANGYIPIFNKNHLYSIRFSEFKNHYAFFESNRELAFKGFDISVGRTLAKKKLWDLSSSLGGYMFFADYHKQAKGGLVKFKSNISLFSLETQVSYDSYFKGIGQIQAALNIPFGKQVRTKTKGMTRSQTNALANRITEEVDRFEMIVSDTHKKKSIGRDPRTGHPMYIVFVNNMKENGNGTFQSPYNSLKKAESHSSAGNMIYVFGGEGISTLMDKGIVLKDLQWLQGANNSFALQSAFGLCGVPVQSHKRPSINNPDGPSIALANQNIVNGFDLRSGGPNILGVNIQDFTVKHCDFIISSLEDISLYAAGGKVSVTHNKSYSAKGIDLHTAKDIHLVIENNTFSNKTASLTIDIGGDSIGKVYIQKSNQFLKGEIGSLIVTSGTSQVDIKIAGNTFESTADNSIYSMKVNSKADSTATVLVEDNLFSSPTPSLALQATLLAKAKWIVLNNTGHYTKTSGEVYPFSFSTDSLGYATLTLKNNYANSEGYILSNDSLSAKFEVISPIPSVVGIENVNTGTVTTTGLITYIPPGPSTP